MGMTPSEFRNSVYFFKNNCFIDSAGIKKNDFMHGWSSTYFCIGYCCEFIKILTSFPLHYGSFLTHGQNSPKPHLRHISYILTHTHASLTFCLCYRPRTMWVVLKRNSKIWNFSSSTLQLLRIIFKRIVYHYSLLTGRRFMLKLLECGKPIPLWSL